MGELESNVVDDGWKGGVVSHEYCAGRFSRAHVLRDAASTIGSGSRTVIAATI